MQVIQSIVYIWLGYLFQSETEWFLVTGHFFCLFFVFLLLQSISDYFWEVYLCTLYTQVFLQDGPTCMKTEPV